MKVLVVFYSRTGNTRKLARLIAHTLNAEIEEIIERASRRGIFGYLRAAADGWFGRRAEIASAHHDPSAFDLVIIGTPVWQVSVATPVRTYLENRREALPQMAFFCTLSGMGSKYVFYEMERLCQKAPLATLACTERQLASADLRATVDTFVARLSASLSNKADPEARGIRQQ